MTYDQWFKSQQGIPYDGSYLFAEAAWEAAQRQAYECAAERCTAEASAWVYPSHGNASAMMCATAIRALIEGDK